MRECPQCRYNYDRGDRFAGMSFVPSFDDAGMRYHAELVHGPLLCPLCEHRYEDFMARQRHLRLVHGLPSVVIKDLCPPRFPRRLVSV